MKTVSDDHARAKIWELIKDIRIAMMVTQDDNRELSARPMAACNKELTDTLWFMTRKGSPKLSEISEQTQVLLAYSEPKDQNYVSVRGKARIATDPAKINELWSEAARVWFPKGPTDPDIVLLAVEIESAEYWDAPASSMLMLYGYAKAALTGKSPDGGENAKVSFQAAS